MAKYRSHSIEFKRQIAQEFLAGDTLHGLEKRHDISRNLIRVWVERYQAGAFDEDAAAAARRNTNRASKWRELLKPRKQAAAEPPMRWLGAAEKPSAGVGGNSTERERHIWARHVVWEPAGRPAPALPKRQKPELPKAIDKASAAGNSRLSTEFQFRCADDDRFEE